MSDFETIYRNIVMSGEEQRTTRLEQNMQQLELTPQQAATFDRASVAVITACVAGMGAAIDQLDGDPQLQSAAMIVFPKILAMNLNSIAEFTGIVGLHTAMTGKAGGCNPDKPDCDCVNCVAARAMTKVMLAADEEASS
jgi:hypothetical protein